ncbi:S41 family peptidase [Riemerella anatipestifer]|uniref:S41 family peptidase n=1 Tax=Riemerella anatipestifer TaxID=34085 RepID=A0AAP3ALJ2_RIEAN|nr:S41 family peptidase [Riemerella anatipestifer]MCU7568295.1 S41 family peptidase [Riemerella anatipestifer]MCW0490273.1 S41 family peptidase [Riemerella anatipestifer]MCW0523847.1 S41 family peptidase [Riemerella anatipestifer]MDR7796755.1 S41 family peptidase [Riemerella anatipestifer]MDY3433161.1 S41 family peptidase [Riemerella anatipestifer]
MHSKVSYIVLLVIVLVSCNSLDRYNRHIETPIPKEKLIKDINYMERVLFKNHPKIDWYIEQKALHYSFDSLRKTIDKPLTPKEFYLKITPVVAKIKQGHITMKPLLKTYSSSERSKYKESKNPLSGLSYYYENGRLFIKKNTKKEADVLLRGMEIVSVNGITPQELYGKYRAGLTSDGYNQTFIPYYFASMVNRFYLNELGFVDSLEIKAKCADSLVIFNAKREFKKTVHRKLEPKGQIKDSLSKVKNEIEHLTKEEKITKRLEQRKVNKKKRIYGYDADDKVYINDLSFPVKGDSSIAVLKIRSFSSGRKKAYDEIFKMLKEREVKHLVLDLRNNLGGSISQIHHLSKYLSQKEFRMIDDPVVVNKMVYLNYFRGGSIVSKILLSPVTVPLFLRKTISTYKDSYGYWRTPIQQSRKTQPKALNYTNKVYVLINGKSFSASSIISAYLKSLPNVTLIGEETSGAHNGTVAGMMPRFELPYSKLNIRFGLLSIEPTYKVDKEGRGVMPNIEFKEKAANIIEEDDRMLNFVLYDLIPQFSIQ